MAYWRTLPSDDGAKTIVAAYPEGGWGEIPASNSGNGTVTIMKPSAGWFAHCVGAARRGLTPLSGKQFGHVMFQETNAFWQLELGDAPEELVSRAAVCAREEFAHARELLAGHDPAGANHARLQGYLDTAEEELANGRDHRDGGDVFELARNARCFTRAQVRARQVINALVPPPTSPEELWLQA